MKLRLYYFEKGHANCTPTSLHFSIKTVEDAQALSDQFRDENSFGASAFMGGNVYDDNNNYLGRVSYNGRFWPKDGKYGAEYKAY